MKENIKAKYHEVLQKIETEELPFSVKMEGLSFQEVETLRYELMNKNLKVNIYEEFKELYIGVSDKN